MTAMGASDGIEKIIEREAVDKLLQLVSRFPPHAFQVTHFPSDGVDPIFLLGQLGCITLHGPLLLSDSTLRGRLGRGRARRQ
jgi:hypothetical protein